MSKEIGDRKLISVAQAAEMIDMSAEWIYRMMRQGTLPFPWYPISCGGRKIDSSEVNAWLDSIKVKAEDFRG